MRILVVPVTGRDPYGPGVLDGEQFTGPILSACASVLPQRVILLAEPQVMDAADRTCEVFEARRPPMDHDLLAVAPLRDPTERAAAWQRELAAVVAEVGSTDVSWVVLLPDADVVVAAGLSLAVAGRSNVELVQIDPAGYVGGETVVTRFRCPGTHDLSSEYGAVHEPAGSYRARPPLHAEASVRDCLEVAVHELGLIAGHASMQQILETVATVAEHPVPVLIQGETGVGKGMIARLIHRLSGRDAGRFVSVNCGAIPPNLIESSLFGHIKGSFTGASSDQMGKFELADGGTLFLDEIGELLLDLQPKLLKVLEDGVVERVGSMAERKVDVRVIAATNRDLKRRVQHGEFREDLFYRLSFVVMDIPPLRERKDDIPRIAARLLSKINRSLRSPKRLSRGAVRRLTAHGWPGNVRDLENVVGRSAMMAPSDLIDAEDLIIDPVPMPEDVYAGLPEPGEGFGLETFLAGARRHLMERALTRAGGNQSVAARLLDLSPQAVHKYLRSRETDPGRPG